MTGPDVGQSGRDPVKTRVVSLMGFAGALAMAVLARAAYLQVLQNPRLEAMSRRQFQSKVLIRPRRGLILDRTGEPLVVNSEVQSLAANPAKIRDRRRLARLLAKATDQPFSRLYEKLGEKREFVWIKRHLTPAELKRFEKWRIMDAEGDLVSGLWMIKENQRVFPHGELAAHVLGHVNLDSEGLEGVELWANEQLTGKVGSVSAVKDALGRPAFIDSVAAQEMREGQPVQLTLDASLQFAVDQELKASVAKTGSRGGSVIVMNAENGEILAMSNQPSFNPNDKSVPPANRRNRTVTDGYEPGSTMKPILLAGALANGQKLTDSIWGEHGTMLVQGKRISEAEAHEKFEWISLKKIIQVSSNVGAAKLAMKLGADKYLGTLKAFGFAGRTEIGFPGEIAGRLPPRKAWQPLTTANIGFGQGLLVTPIQMARAYAVFANGGWLVQPTLLKTPLPGFKPVPPQRIVGTKVINQVIEAMESVTQEGGTGLKAGLEGYRVAGKTGTAQTVDPTTGKYSRTRYIPSFIGFAVGVEPKLVVFASLDDPKGIYYAAETAAPLFHNVLQAAVSRFSIPASGDKSNQALATRTDRVLRGLDPNVQTTGKHNGVLSDRLQMSLAKVQDAPEEAPSRVVEWQGNAAAGGQLWKMPSLRGLSARQAIQALQGHTFRLEVSGVGIIKSQSPEIGATIADGQAVRLELAEP